MNRKTYVLAFCALALSLTALVPAEVLPTTGHMANNSIPFRSGGTVHQVFNSVLFGTNPVRISEIGFAPAEDGTFDLADFTIRFGYTSAIPGVSSASGGLTIPHTLSGGGNNVGPMSVFAQELGYSITTAFSSSENFQMRLSGSFDYDPNQGNLLMEIVSTNDDTGTFFVSRTVGSSESSRTFNVPSGTSEDFTRALRIDFVYEPVPEPASLSILALGAAGVVVRRRKASK